MISPIAVDQSPVSDQLPFSWVEASGGPHIQADQMVEHQGIRRRAFGHTGFIIGASMEGDGSIHFVVEEASNGAP